MGKVQKSIKVLTEVELRGLTTRNLVSYLRRLHECLDGPDENEREHRRNYVYKKSEAWSHLYYLAKSVLAEREHLSRKGEA